jgi:predicted neuraminidase
MARSLLSLLLIAAATTPTLAAEFEHARLITQPGPEFADAKRSWQGIPGIERAPGGRLWAVWYTGGPAEGDMHNYGLLATSGDEGRTWSPPCVAIQGKPGIARIGDPLPWLDPRGRLWVFYRQVTLSDDGKRTAWAGTCAIRTDEPNVENPKWSEPTIIGKGDILFGKPVVRADGTWLAPFFAQGKTSFNAGSHGHETGCIASADAGATWSWRGGTTIAEVLRNFSEATLAERNDNRVWMVIRTRTGLYESSSSDGGKTWAEAKPLPQFVGPATRAHVRRLKSGAFLLIYHDAPKKSGGAYGRERLTAWLSDDEGKTWPHKLLVDERNRVSYPDATEGPDGRIYVAYDFGRYQPEQKQIVLAVFREADVRAGKFTSPDALEKIVISRATASTEKPPAK